VPALNTDAGFITDMVDLVDKALQSPVVSLAEAVVQNSDDGLDFSSNVRLAAIDSSQDSFDGFSFRDLPLSGVRGGVAPRRTLGGSAGRAYAAAQADERALGRVGLLERDLGRVGMLAFLATIVAEAANGLPLLRMLGL
jgi:hypothetical protein